MLGIDDRILQLDAGGGVIIALVVALLLGLRHATDPDHLTALSTLVLGDRGGAARATRLGAAWGCGHGTALLGFGLPAMLMHRHLPEPVHRGAEVLVGLVIIGLAGRLLIRWRRGYLHVHVHEHDGVRHAHAHVHEHPRRELHPAPHDHAHAEALGRTPAAAFAIGLLHGVGGSGGASVLLIGAIPRPGVAAVALAVFAVGTAASMTAVSGAFGATLVRRPVSALLERAVPALATASLLFGIAYAFDAPWPA